ncbi:hypothetical protein AY601_1523 [Pedobacter cryoconitis]|uniref:Zeta toxin domain-containing protein n=1 Tax=Pedobacter cryoconitis TaxID=188932 RepID=A0A127VB39_9SPHI|nr:zeta toxin family protein [Pedobacter cryoconitis]AMP98439.1 hypothetical protein AY601_1523 [Pedobacter cryoconitis]
MIQPELIFVSGCNASGKSTFIRTRLNELEGFEILMTDVYKERTKELATAAIAQRKNIVIETVFNDRSFKDLVDHARNSGYHTSLIVLFLDNFEQSMKRVTLRIVQQNGMNISGSNIRINFNESFKNIATYFLYFDRSEFIYTEIGEVNQSIMSFENGELVSYYSSGLNYPQKFAAYSFQKDRLSKEVFDMITANQNFHLPENL